MFRDIHRRKFKKLLARLRQFLSQTEDAHFLQLAWAVNALQSESGPNVGRYLRFPEGAATTDPDSPWLIYKWEIETLVLLRLTNDEASDREYDCTRFETLAQAVKLLRKVDDSEYAASGDPREVMFEMHRLSHRQFPWQRGFATSEILYRFAYMFGLGNCATYFEQTHGLKVVEFLKIGFLLFSLARNQPWNRIPDLEKFGVDAESLRRALNLIARSISDISGEVNSLINSLPEGNSRRIAYWPSAIRRFPIVISRNGRNFISPLPDLVIHRITAGLYYDFRGGPQSLTTEANKRFEHYVLRLMKAFFPRFVVLPSQTYGPRKSQHESPDVLLKDGGELVAVIECKATKLTHGAQFADDPLSLAGDAYDQISKGVAQLWRFFSDVRRGVFNQEPVAQSAHAVLLTLDNWLQTSVELRSNVIAKAKGLIRNDPDVIEADMRSVVFCSMQDLTDVLHVSDEDDLPASFSGAVESEFLGWSLLNVRRKVGGQNKNKQFPLQIEELLPWWQSFGKEG